MNRRSLFFVLLSLIFGVGAVMLAQNWLKQRQTLNVTPDQAVVVAMAVDAPSGVVLERKHLTLQAVPKEFAIKDAYTEYEQAIGKVTKFPLLRGDTLHAAKVANKGEGSVLASLISPNKRAVSIRVNDVVGVAGFLLPGNRVDVLVTFQSEALGQSGKQAQTDVVLSNLKVLAVDQKANQDSSQPIVVRAVTLEVSLEEAEVLMSARSKGNIQLALRNPNDDAEIQVVKTESIPEPDALTSIPTPVTLPQATPPASSSPSRKIEVIRGTQQHTVAVDSNY